MNTTETNPLSPGAHTVELNGIVQAYHVYGSGPVCLAHSGGPGVFWDYMRMPAAEEHLTMVYVEPIGTGASGRLPHHPNGYTRERYSDFLDQLIQHLGVPRVHLLGHSHGGFVTQHFAQHYPHRLNGIILYESAPVTGEEHMAVAMGYVGEFMKRNEQNPELPGVMNALQSTGSISNDEEMTTALRGLTPAYFADYWGREAEFAAFRVSVSGSHISGVDEDLAPIVIDDREALKSLTLPALVVVGRCDVICGVRWAEELNKLIAGSKLLILENSGHFGHVEEPAAFAQAVTEFVTSTSA